MKIGLIFGTRPEAIKMASLYHQLIQNDIETKVILTGQHKEMLEQVLSLFNIKSDYNIEIMKEKQELSELTGRLIIELDKVIKQESLDYILVQGDTTSAFTGALVGFYNKIPVGHIEAGLRTGNIYSPFPEEINRKLIGPIADMHFAPTDVNVKNLIKEGISEEKILKCGNTVIDSLKWIITNKSDILKKIREKYNINNKKYILLTMHRRENWGEPMKEVLSAIKDYINQKENFYIVFPMHLNPKVRETINETMKDCKNKILLEPLEYLEFIAVMEKAHYIMTDSGGIQEEAPTLGKPTLVLRDTTERPEAIEAGTAKLIGTSYRNVFKYMELLEGKLYQDMSKVGNPYGDGKTSERICQYLQKKM
jgi:UDP-N-acetylglucosamine 2-epimerase